jgi:hypothetical protein
MEINHSFNKKLLCNILYNFNIKFIINLLNLSNFSLIYNFYNDNLLNFAYNKDLLEGYKYIMKTPLVKFNNKFRLARSSFLELDEFVETVYSLPLEILTFYKKTNIKESLNLSIKIFKENFINYFFLKDINNINNINNLIKEYNIFSLYTKLKYLAYYLVDPFFFFHFYYRCFPDRLRKYRLVYSYISTYVVQYEVDNITRYNFKKFKLL